MGRRTERKRDSVRVLMTEGLDPAIPEAIFPKRVSNNFPFLFKPF